MQPQTGVEVRIYSFLTSVKNECGWLTSRPSRFTSEKQTQCLFYRKRVWPRNVLDGFWRIENPLPQPTLFYYLFIYLSGLSELSDGYCSEKLAVELNPLCPRRSDKPLTDRGRPKPKSCFTLHQVAM